MAKCRDCSNPASTGQRCTDCRRRDTLYQRKRRASKPRTATRARPTCSLCLTVGHMSRSCELNADAIR